MSWRIFPTNALGSQSSVEIPTASRHSPVQQDLDNLLSYFKDRF